MNFDKTVLLATHIHLYLHKIQRVHVLSQNSVTSYPFPSLPAQNLKGCMYLDKTALLATEYLSPSLPAQNLKGCMHFDEDSVRLLSFGHPLFQLQSSSDDILQKFLSPFSFFWRFRALQGDSMFRRTVILGL